MRIVVEPGKRKRSDLAEGVGGPEKGFLIVSAGRNASASRQAVLEARARVHGDAAPDDGAAEDDAGPDRGSVGDKAVRRVDVSEAPEATACGIEVAGPGGEGPSPSERFERRAEEIARAAEVRERPIVKDEADLLGSAVEQGLPQVGDERGLARGNPVDKAGRQDADPRVEERPLATGPEARDAVPFGLKRRVPVGMPVFRHQERRGASRFAVSGDERREVGRDRGVGVHDEKIRAAEKGRGVSQGAGGAEDRRLVEERELWRARRLLAQHALDLLGQVMEIYRHLSDAGLLKAPQVLHRHGNVQER